MNASQFSLLNHIKPPAKVWFLTTTKNYHVTTLVIFHSFQSNLKFAVPTKRLITLILPLPPSLACFTRSFLINAFSIFAFNQINLHKTFHPNKHSIKCKFSKPSTPRKQQQQQRQQISHLKKNCKFSQRYYFPHHKISKLDTEKTTKKHEQ